MNRDEVTKELTLGGFDDALITLYGDDEETLAAQRKRYIRAIKSFETIYPFLHSYLQIIPHAVLNQ